MLKPKCSVKNRVCYPTWEEAMTALRIAQKNKKKGDRRPRKVYYCPWCEEHHISTHWDRKQETL